MHYQIRNSFDYDGERDRHDRYPTEAGYYKIRRLYSPVAETNVFGTAIDAATGMALNAFLEGNHEAVVTVWEADAAPEALPIYVATPADTFKRYHENLANKIAGK